MTIPSLRDAPKTWAGPWRCPAPHTSQELWSLWLTGWDNLGDFLEEVMFPLRWSVAGVATKEANLWKIESDGLFKVGAAGF